VPKHRTKTGVSVCAVLIACAAAGCSQTVPRQVPVILPPAVEALGRPQTVSTQQSPAEKDTIAIAHFTDAAVGLSGGCLIAASRAMLDQNRLDLARQANTQAEQNPATPAQARQASTADLNGDGFVTIDEVIAMRRAGLDDRQMIDRLKSAGQIFAISPKQRQYLLDRGISRDVLDAMDNLDGAVATADRVP
jgi:hypothetical protein